MNREVSNQSGAMRRGLILIAATCVSGLLIGGTAQAVTWSPPSLSFTKQKVGITSVSQQVVLNGEGYCGVDTGVPPEPGPCFPEPLDIAVSGDFLITANNCPSALGRPGSPGGPPAHFPPENPPSCAVSVAFKPNAIGGRTGFLRLKSNPIQGVALYGKGCKKPKKGKLRCKKKKGK
jgi:hypothetical protein